jgi:hypothetical protein
VRRLYLYEFGTNCQQLSFSAILLTLSVRR